MKKSRLMMAIATTALMSGVATESLAVGWTADIGGGAGGGGTLMQTTENLVKNSAARTRNIVYGVGGLGAIALAVLAFFGRFQWAWFFGLVGGLALIAGINTGIEYITGEAGTLTARAN